MDIEPSAPILTLASTNDATALDAAAIRTARFDSIIEITYPDRAMATKILETYLAGVPGHADVKPSTVAAHFASDISGADIREIVRLILRQLELRLHERNITLELTDAALDICARNGYDPIYGARPLKRYVQKALETDIARAIIAGDIRDGGTIRVVDKDDHIEMHFHNPEPAAKE